MVKPIFRVALDYPIGGVLDGGLQGLAGAGLGRAQPRFELAEGQFNGVEIGRVRRQIQQAGAAGFDEFGRAGHFVGRQVVEHDHVAGYECGAEHLVQVSGKYVAVAAPSTLISAPRPSGVSAAMSVTFGPPCRGVAWWTRCPPSARA